MIKGRPSDDAKRFIALFLLFVIEKEINNG